MSALYALCLAIQDGASVDLNCAVVHLSFYRRLEKRERPWKTVDASESHTFDLPFSALQFAFYEQSRRLAVQAMGSPDIGFGLEVLTAVSAGGMAGAITCPLDVIKTRTQTQITSHSHEHSSQSSKLEKVAQAAKGQRRFIHSGPRTVPSTVPTLDTSSILTGLKMIYKTEGVAGWFRGVGPRFVWTSVQSGTMLVLYQYLLKQFERMSEPNDGPRIV